MKRLSQNRINYTWYHGACHGGYFYYLDATAGIYIKDDGTWYFRAL